MKCTILPQLTYETISESSKIVTDKTAPIDVIGLVQVNHLLGIYLYQQEDFDSRFVAVDNSHCLDQKEYYYEQSNDTVTIYDLDESTEGSCHVCLVEQFNQLFLTQVD